MLRVDQQTGEKNEKDYLVSSRMVNGHHCNIRYMRGIGWTINEVGKDKLSVKGTFVFVKNHQQLIHNEPSNLVLIKKKVSYYIGPRSTDYLVTFDYSYQSKEINDFQTRCASERSAGEKMSQSFSRTTLKSARASHADLNRTRNSGMSGSPLKSVDVSAISGS